MYHRHSVHPPVTSCYIHMTSPHPSIIVPTTSLQTAGITVRTSEWFRAKDRTAEGEDSDLRQRNFGWRISILWSRGCRKIDVFHCRCVPGLVMTNSSPWYRRLIEIDDLPNLIAWWFSMAMLNNQMVHVYIRFKAFYLTDALKHFVKSIPRKSGSHWRARMKGQSEFPAEYLQWKDVS